MAAGIVPEFEEGYPDLIAMPVIHAKRENMEPLPLPMVDIFYLVKQI